MRLLLIMASLAYSFAAEAGEDWIMFKWTRDPEHREVHEFVYANGQAMHLTKIEAAEMSRSEHVPKWKFRDVDEREARLIAESLSALVSKSKNDKRNKEARKKKSCHHGFQWAVDINSSSYDVEYTNWCDKVIKFDDLTAFVGEIFGKNQVEKSPDLK